jgi:hypothetical protein
MRLQRTGLVAQIRGVREAHKILLRKLLRKQSLRRLRGKQKNIQQHVRKIVQ